MKEKDKLNKHIAEHLIPHIATQLRQINGYDSAGNLECERCKRRGARKNRQRTSYIDDESNWATLCPDCQEEADEYWDERWREHYGNICGC